eukprot:scaffold93655_cov24-Tisochrysis_lutea.AAC.2
MRLRTSSSSERASVELLSERDISCALTAERSSASAPSQSEAARGTGSPSAGTGRAVISLATSDEMPRAAADNAV